MMSFKNKAILNEHKAAIYALCEAEEDHVFYSGGSDGYVIRWNLKKMQAEKVVSKAPTTIISLAYIKLFNFLLIGQIEGGVHVISLTDNKEVKYLKNHSGYIFDILFIKEKNEVVFSSGDGTISIWSVPEFKLLFQTRVGEDKNRKMAYSEERQELAVASADGLVQIFNTTDWSKKHALKEIESAANAVCYRGNKLLTGTKNAHLHSFDFLSGKSIEGIPAHNWALYDIAVNKELNLLATASRDKTVKIWDPDQLKILKRFEGLKDKGHTHSVNCLLWSGYHNFLLSAGDDKVIRVWEITP